MKDELENLTDNSAGNSKNEIKDLKIRTKDYALRILTKIWRGSYSFTSACSFRHFSGCAISGGLSI
jgi:hypothetical protein